MSEDSRARLLADFTAGKVPVVPAIPAKKERASASLAFHRRRRMLTEGSSPVAPANTIARIERDGIPAKKAPSYKAPAELTNARHGDKSALNKLRHSYAEHLARMADPVDAFNYAVIMLPPIAASTSCLDSMVVRAKANHIPSKRWLLAHFERKFEAILEDWSSHPKRPDYEIEVKLAFLRAIDKGEFATVWNQIEVALNVDGARDREQFFARIRQELFDMGARPLHE